MEAVGLLGMLGICTYDDIKRRQIKAFYIPLFGILGVLLHLYFRSISIWDMLGGAIIGVVLYMISIASKERIGKGDALLVGVMGLYVGFWNNLMIFWGASGLVGIAAIILFFLGKKKTRIPFVPFLLISFLVYLVLKEAGDVG